MHKTEGANNSSNEFTDGPPGTTVEKNWLNAVQDEITYMITQAGLSLKTAANETGIQLYTAIEALYARKVMASGEGIDFSADSKGVFKGAESIIYRMVNNSGTASETPLGPNGTADWEIASEFENESALGGAGVVAQEDGIFTFGSTGYWDVTFHIAANDPSTTSSQAFTYLQSETGTGYTNIARAHHGVFLTGGYGSGSASAILKVESTDDTVQLSYSNGSGSCYIMGNTSYSTTHIKFTKLADL